MLLKIAIITLSILMLGCSSLQGKKPFQVYAPKDDCVACKEQERWGFSKHRIFRNGQIVYFASYLPKTTRISAEEVAGLCLGTALDTLQSGATHSRILSKEKWGNWQYVKTPASVTKDPLGAINIYGEGMVRKNLDPFMWWTNHYYLTGSPDCAHQTETCSNFHKYDVRDCPYDGDELRKMTEEQRGTLACVMKRNPQLLFEKVYSVENWCGHESDGWISASDVVKQYSTVFQVEQSGTVH
jgi:hypothetical protein